MHGKTALLAGATLALAVPVAAQGPIQHEAIGCMVAERHPEFRACFADASAVARVRVNFRAAGGHSWYYVDMRRRGGEECFDGLLPQPSPRTKRIDYYIDATSRAFGESRTPDYHPQVTSPVCPSRFVVAGGLTSASVVVGSLTAGAPALPAGFASVGVVAATGTTTATTAGAGSASAGGGGGAGKALLIVGGLGAAGAGAYFGLKKERDACDGATVTVTVSRGPSP